MAASGWYRDPTGQADGRYWDGQRWSDQVDRQGVTVSSPIDPAQAATPPSPGSDYVVPSAPSSAGSQTVAVQSAKSSVVGPVFAAIAVVVAIVALVVALSNNSDDDTEPEESPTTTAAEAPETTAGE